MTDDSKIAQAQEAVRAYLTSERDSLRADRLVTVGAALNIAMMSLHEPLQGIAAKALDGDPYAHRLLQQRATHLVERGKELPPELMTYIISRFLDRGKPIRESAEPRKHQYFLRDSIIAHAVELAIGCGLNPTAATSQPSSQTESACDIVAKVLNMPADTVYRIWATVTSPEKHKERFGRYRYVGRVSD